MGVSLYILGRGAVYCLLHCCNMATCSDKPMSSGKYNYKYVCMRIYYCKYIELCDTGSEATYFSIACHSFLLAHNNYPAINTLLSTSRSIYSKRFCGWY